MSLAVTHAPQNVEDVKGQEQALSSLQTFLTEFKKGKAALIYGPIGCGKTSLVYALARVLDKEVFEVNASDVRNKKNIEETLGAATKQQSLLGFGKGKIILFDDIDGLSGRQDRGGASALTKIIKESSFPIVLTANDPSAKKFKDLKKVSQLIACEPLAFDAVFSRLQEICEKEKIAYDEEGLRSLARRAGGDMRGAITDLEVAAFNGSIDLSLLDERDRTDDIEQALLKIFKTKDIDIARHAFDTVSENPDQYLLWIDENLPKEYDKEALAKAYDHISKADRFFGRIRRWQYWRLLVYYIAHLSAGVAISKEEKSKTPPKYTRPDRILQMWIAKMKYQKRDSIAQKVAAATHTSVREARETLTSMRFLTEEAVAKKLDLTADEVAWLQR